MDFQHFSYQFAVIEDNRIPTRPRGSRVMPPTGLQICLRPRVTLNFDLLTSKLIVSVPLPRGPFAPIVIKVSQSVFKTKNSDRSLTLSVMQNTTYSLTELSVRGILYPVMLRQLTTLNCFKSRLGK